MKIKWNFTASTHNTHNYKVTIFLLFIYFQKARLSVRILQYRTRVTDELILKRLLCRGKKLENTQRAVFIPTNEGIFPLFRHVNATTARYQHGEIQKFQCSRHAHHDCSIVECFKTKIIDFKSFSTSSCWCLLFHSLSLMKCDVQLFFYFSMYGNSSSDGGNFLSEIFWIGIDY